MADRAEPGHDGQAQSIAVMVRLERPVLRNADIGGLLGAELGQLRADLGKVQARDLLVEMLGQGVDLLLVFAGLA